MDIPEEALAKRSGQSPPRPRRRSEPDVSLRIESAARRERSPYDAWPTTSDERPRGTSLNPPVAYQIKITLADIQPAIWRRVLVPGLLTLDQLHLVIQQLMGWINAHLDEFVIGGQRYRMPDPDMPVSTVLPDRRVRLQDVAPPPGGHFVYRYDFGDGWEVEIAVEQILAAGPHGRGSACLDGARHGPPEDCGGPAGYAELLTALRDPSRSEHEAMRGWVGRRFDPERFDVDATNRALRKSQ